MKSIGLFGDSFAGVSSLPSFKFHWISLLAEKLNAKITNYGMGGSSVYYSYKHFMQNYQEHDINIFLVTEPNRYIKEVETNKHTKIFIPNISTLDNVNYNHIVYPDANTLRGWFLASDEEFNTDMSSLMVEKIYELDNSCLFIPCFYTSALGTVKDYMPINLHYLQEYQSKLYGFKSVFNIIDDYQEHHEIVSGHFIPEINKLLFSIILKKLETGVWDCKIPDKLPLEYSANSVWVKKEK